MKLNALRRRGRLIAALAATALGTSMLTGTSTPVAGAAAPSTLKLIYKCDYPLIGMQDIAVSIEADLPTSTPVGKLMELKKVEIISKTVIPAETTEALNVMKAATLEGTASAKAQVDEPGLATPFSVGLTIPSTPIPESGPFTIVAKGFPSTNPGFETPGWGYIGVLNLNLRITPKDKAGHPTALGKLNGNAGVNCYQVPGQVNTLVQIAIGDEPGPKPPPPYSFVESRSDYARSAFESRKTAKEFVYTCQKLPIIGNVKVKVKTSIDYPARIPAQHYAPKIKIDSVTVLDEETVEGLNTNFTATVEGAAIADAAIIAPQIPNGGPLAAQVTLPIKPAQVPQSDFGPWPTMNLPAEGNSLSLVFNRDGAAKMAVGNLAVTMSLKQATGQPTDLGTYTRVCVMDPGQDPAVTSFDVLPNSPPSAAGDLTASAVTQNSFHLDWPDSTDSDGDKVLYQVQMTSPTGRPLVDPTPRAGSEIDVKGLAPGTEYTISVRAADSRYAFSSGSSDLTVTTLAEGEAGNKAPAVPTGVKSSAITSNGFHLDWADTADPDGDAVAYEIHLDGKKVAANAPASEADATGLTAGTAYKVTVLAVDAKGGRSEPSSPLSVTTAE